VKSSASKKRPSAKGNEQCSVNVELAGLKRQAE
jgi:hypothetical protein